MKLIGLKFTGTIENSGVHTIVWAVRGRFSDFLPQKFQPERFRSRQPVSWSGGYECPNGRREPNSNSA